MSNRTYVVHRLACDAYGTTVWQNEGGNSIFIVPLRAFADRAAAEACVAELARAARRTLNLFATHFFYNAASVQALELPLRVKPSDKWGEVEWQRWYEAEAPHLTDDERAKIWSLFDARPLYGIREVPLGDE